MPVLFAPRKNYWGSKKHLLLHIWCTRSRLDRQYLILLITPLKNCWDSIKHLLLQIVCTRSQPDWPLSWVLYFIQSVSFCISFEFLWGYLVKESRILPPVYSTWKNRCNWTQVWTYKLRGIAVGKIEFGVTSLVLERLKKNSTN